MKNLVKILVICALMLSTAAVYAATMIKIDGSSTVYPITEAMAEEYQNATKGKVRIIVGISGTGGGFKKFVRKQIDIADASRPIKSSEQKEARLNGVDYIELPVAYDGMAVVVNKSNTFVDKLTVAELKKIWEPAAQGNIKLWSQVRDGWPELPIKLYGPGTDSGTFDYFTEAVVGASGKSRGDYTASEDDNVLVQGVSGDKGALGYFGVAYYEENKDKLKVVPIENGKGAVYPTYENVENGVYQPLSRPIFIYVNKDAAGREEVKGFVEFYLEKAPEYVKQVGYISLPASVYELAKKKFADKKTGTVFKGATIGVSAEELMKK